MLIIRDAVFWDVSRDLLRFCQRADPLVVVELLRGRLLLLLQERRLRVEQEGAVFPQVSRGPLDLRMSRPRNKHPLASSCEGDDGAHVFLPFASRTRSTHWRHFDVDQRSDTRLASTLLLHRAPRQFVSPSSPSDSGRFGTLRACGMSSCARTARSKGCSPVPAAVCRACAAPPTRPFTALLIDPQAVGLASRAVRLSAAACSLLFCEATQSSAARGPWRSNQ